MLTTYDAQEQRTYDQDQYNSNIVIIVRVGFGNNVENLVVKKKIKQQQMLSNSTEPITMKKNKNKLALFSKLI